MQQTTKTRSSSSEVPCHRAARQLRPAAALDINSASSLSQPNKTSKNRSPKVAERRSPRSPLPERKRPSRISELESQISQLKEDLKKAREELSLSESCKKQAQEDAEESKEQLVALSVKLEDSQKKLSHNSAVLNSAINEIQQLKVQLELVATFSFRKFTTQVRNERSSTP